MLGGATVRTKKDATRYSEALQREVAIGEQLEEEPCVGDAYLARERELFGRECPRVALEEENAIPATLASAAPHEHLRWLALAVMEYGTADLRDEQRSVLARRALRALQDPEVREKMFPKPEGRQ